jgi:DNA-binding response OmpR family regulator
MDRELERRPGRRRRQDIGGSAACREMSVGDQPHRAAKAQREIEVMSDDDGGLTGIAVRAQHLEHAASVGGIEAGGWLVEEQALGALAQRLRENHATRLAPRELVEAARGEASHITGRHRGAGGGDVGIARQPEATLARIAAQQHDLLDDERECQLVLLRQVGELARDDAAVDAGWIVAQAPNCPTCGGDEPGQRSEQGGLARTVGADDDDEVTGVCSRADPTHHGTAAQRDVDVLELQPHAALVPSRSALGNAVANGLVRRRNDRVVMNLPVEIITGGKKVRAVSQDLSPMGMFIRMSPPLPAGTVIQVVISPNGHRHVMTGQITHALTEVEARTLGRFPGMGVMFREAMRPSEQAFLDAVSRLLQRSADAARPLADLRILVADPQTRILERLSTALGGAGFLVATATNGIEAIGACLSKPPDVALIERDMPVVDGLHVLQELGRHGELASVPVMMMSANATDLARLQAFQLGAADFIPKPFTVLEVILRARRWARASQRDTERVVLRGTLSEVSLPTLLQMFEQEKKSGQLSVTRDQLVAWIDFVEGRIVRARSSEADTNARQTILKVLDWRQGYFELSAGVPAAGTIEVEDSVTHLLLEHARIRDEQTRT